MNIQTVYVWPRDLSSEEVRHFFAMLEDGVSCDCNVCKTVRIRHSDIPQVYVDPDKQEEFEHWWIDTGGNTNE